MPKTSEIANDLHGEKLYQERARRILPILVRQAASKRPLSYEFLADELNMTNPRVLNYPLGCVGRALIELTEDWGTKIPHIQSLVVNKQTGLPGPGFDGFLTDEDYKWIDKTERKSVIEQYRVKIYEYPYWDEVLSSLRLKPVASGITDLINEAAYGRGQGEGQAHKALKEFVRNNPVVIGLSPDHPKGRTEHSIPSGDRLDILFAHKGRVCVAEVKPRNAPLLDITRGLFQCVKYRAVLEANAAFANVRADVTVCLALGGNFPDKLIPLRNSLQVHVFENLADQIPLGADDY
ncbi:MULTISPECIES: hypothetical protein [unclassified Methylobacterium]|uniref:hypothetical protein n=1 Tax=unclassified Methylobacterium TaxID=2615210 RepID=UPI000B0353E2|nr:MULTISPECIES: hypothetical protein [unclassified Methylobacterium]